MTHPGLPYVWGIFVALFMLILSIWALYKQASINAIKSQKNKYVVLSDVKYLRPIINYLNNSYWPLYFLKTIVLIFFILVIYAGLNGNQIPQNNLATVLTWNIWWAGLIISVFFFSSSWCAVCPWDTLANLFVKPNFMNKLKFNNSLELTAPKWMRNVWPALFFFIGLTWLELGVGITTSPYWTALLSLFVVVSATLTLAIFKNKAFCHYLCPVGRTVGFYSQLAPVELRPVDSSVCSKCTTLDCYNGTDTVDACPTQLVMGKLTQNTYCTSCGNCTKSCPENNISWRLRPQSHEAVNTARPHLDEALFMLCLLSLTAFHGVTMMEFWEGWISKYARLAGDSGQLLMSFTLGLLLCVLIPIGLYSISILLTKKISKTTLKFKKIFTGMVFVTLPLAFSYHLAHNLNHMIRESVGASKLFLDPLGIGNNPPSLSDNLLKQYNMIISQDVLFMFQALLMMFGFWISIKVLRYRSYQLLLNTRISIVPVLVFMFVVNSFNLWMLSQPMVMRLGMCIAPELTFNQAGI